MYLPSFARTLRRGPTAAATTVVTLTLVILYWQRQAQHTWRNRQVIFPGHHESAPLLLGADAYETISISGYVNTNIPNGPNCDDIRSGKQQLAVTKSIYLEDDLLLMAENLNHPMIDYSTQPKGLGFKEQLRRTWGRMAGSSVWLEQYSVYFTVSRVYFYNTGVKHWPSISFIRAQIYDQDWNHLDNFELEWGGQNFTYPQVLSIPSYFEVGEAFFGPEDPRIVIESGVPDAEPIIIFNMMDKAMKRSMNIHRPFSNFTTSLYIENGAENYSEKNWSPFFMPSTDPRYPSTHIHFVYDLHPLKILRCHVMNGFCQWAYQQDQLNIGWDAYTKDHEYPDDGSVMRGGTNFIPVPFDTRPGLISFIGFPRTHTKSGCGKKDAVYRPVLTLLTTNGTHYWLDYTSDYLDFGQSVLTAEQSQDPCNTGRILLGNGIARYEHEEGQDVMTMLFTVADSTVQVARITGIRQLVQSLPQMEADRSEDEIKQTIPARLNITHDLLVCSILSVSNYTQAHSPDVNNTDLENTTEDD